MRGSLGACALSAFVAATALAAPGGVPPGAWPQWRGNPQQTGTQSLPGRIITPRVAASFRLGGQISSTQILQGPAASDLLVLTPPGSIEALHRDGTARWTEPFDPHPLLVGIFDIRHDGNLQIVATTADHSGGFIAIFDAQTGARLWSSPMEAGGTGAVKLADLNGDGVLDLVWAPAASPHVRAYSFAAGFDQPALLWDVTLPDYISDPYTFSPIVVGDVDGDGSAEVVIFGGRGSVTLWMLDAATGAAKDRVDYLNEDPDDPVTEGGGYDQMLMLRDAAHDGNVSIVGVGAYANNASYMFQGAIVVAPAHPSSASILNSRPYGLRFVDGSVQDFDGDGKDDLLVSTFDPVAQEHIVELLDLPTLSVKAQIANERLEAVLPGANGQPCIIVSEGATTEEPAFSGHFTALHFSAGSFQRASWTINAGGILTFEPLYDARPDVANGGARAVTADVDGNGIPEALFRGIESVSAVDTSTGATLASIALPSGTGLQAFEGSALSGDRILFGLTDGDLVDADAALEVGSTVTVGGYFQLNAANGHNNEMAVAADLDGDGVNEIYATSSGADLLRIDYGGAAASSTVFRSGDGLPEPVMIAGSTPSMLIRQCSPEDVTVICNVSDSTTLWSASTATVANSPPVALNVGERADGTQRIIFGSGSSSYPMESYALDADTGNLLWHSDTGPYWDASFAVSDFNGDLTPDVVLNSNVEKGAILSGSDGTTLCQPVLSPMYRDLGYVDYNGVPIVLSLDGTSTNVLVGEDDGHMMLLSPCTSAGGSTTLVWSAEQANVDDERNSMPAIAPTASATLVGVGTRHGTLIARDAATGATVWQKSLFGGTFGSGPNVLSSVVAVDVDGRNGYDFVVGGSDGWLYALNATTGDLVWSLNLGEAVGDPIAADVDGDGASELLVPVADGTLDIIDGTAISGDFNSDGSPDLVFRNNASGQNAAWLMSGTSLSQVVDLPGLPNSAYEIAAAADFNGDGNIDLLFRNYVTGQNAIWLMKGAAVAQVVDLPGLPNTAYRFAGAADFDHDGKPDILIRNTATGANAVWLMNGMDLKQVVDLPALSNTDYEFVGTGDFNGDGFPDIVLRNARTGQNALWLMNGTALLSIVDLPGLSDPNFRVGAVADLNGDGMPDIVFRNGSTGQNAVWLMNRTSFSGIVDLPAIPNTSFGLAGPR
ncbi:MAG TPA: FG-GAP-like repeat-containing protein [Thermoanaerobaculia bacterium]|nr:FG-GAP-like repeat-containing protein [Thermoanaerobaculia bacterium]